MGYPSKYVIQIYKDSQWKSIEVTIYYHKNKDVDLVLMYLGEGKFVTPITYLNKHQEDIYISQECYIVGFPDGRSLPDQGINQGFPLPYIKKGIISGNDNKGDATEICIDGYGNQGGSSGSPVVIKNSFGEYQIIGVHCTTNQHYERVIDQDGYTVTLNENDTAIKLYCSEPTGITVALSFHHIKEIIDTNKLNF